MGQNASRDDNPACSMPGDTGSSVTRERKPNNAPPAPPVAVATAGPIVTSYDKSGVLPQCAEGPAEYMTNCAHP